MGADRAVAVAAAAETMTAARGETIWPVENLDSDGR
jgi:hypothetical protein